MRSPKESLEGVCQARFLRAPSRISQLLSYGVPAARIYAGCQATALAHDYDAARVQGTYEAAAARKVQAPRFIYVGRLAAEKGESLSYGCPVVVSDRCGRVPELVVNGVTGFAFPAGNIEALSAAMLAATLLSENRSATARQCLKLVSDFTPERAAEKIVLGCKATVSQGV
jgi:hypothetical protein